MIRLTLKSLKIVESEIYNNKLIRYIANIGILLLVFFLQFGDITWKVTGNYIILVWIAMNVCLTFDIYLKNDRKHILCLGKLSNVKRYVFLIFLCIITNLLWLPVLLLQLLVGFEAYWINAIVIVFIQYIYAISLGTVCGSLKIKGIGVALIGLFGIYNFVFCNPYNYKASSHMFIVSEPIFTVNNLNAECIVNYILFALLFFTLAYCNVKINTKKKRKTPVLIILLFIALYAVFLQSTLCRYYNGMNEEYKKSSDQSNINYRGISDIQIVDIESIIELMKDEYYTVSGKKLLFGNVYVQEQYLPEMMWLIKGLDVKPIEINDNILNINIVSPNMLYFENSDLLKCFLEEVSVEMEMNVSGYDESKFTRHVINGYSMGILEKVSDRLELESSREIYDYYREYHDEMLMLPATKYNYVKKIAYIVYFDYPEYTDVLYTSIYEKEISSDEEFINLLKEDFKEIYENKKVVEILNAIY